METNTLERELKQEEAELVKMRCPQSGEWFLVPKEIHEQAQRGDMSIADKEFVELGFYVSPGLGFYKTKGYFYLFCED
jgi:hypothetical protein